MERAGEILKKLLNIDVYSKGEKYISFFSNWKKIIGKKLYGHCEIDDIVNNTLILKVDHPVFIQELNFREKSILRLIRSLYPELKIELIRVKMDFKKKMNQMTNNINNLKTISNSTLNINLFNKIKDNQLRESLKKLYMNLLKSNRRVDTR